MNLVGKILVLAIFAMSLIFMSFAVAVYGTHQNWKEKAVAAHRTGISHVIIPHGNIRDLEEIPEDVRVAVTFHPVRTMDEVLGIALRGVAAPAPVASQRIGAEPGGGAGRGAVAH